MKNLLTIALFASIGYFTACSSDDSGGDAGGFNFVNQNAQGTIDGIAFALGEASADDFLTSDDEFSIDLFDTSEEFTDVCDVFFGDQVSVFFDIPGEVGIYELSFDLNNLEESRTVTLFNPDGAVNIIATEGAVEITEITSTTISGRIDARGTDSSVNGNWTATICVE